MQLDIAEDLLRPNAAGTLANLHVAILHLPAGGPATGRAPLRKVLSVEKHHGIRRRRNRRARLGRTDNRRAGPSHVVALPALRQLGQELKIQTPGAKHNEAHLFLNINLLAKARGLVNPTMCNLIAPPWSLVQGIPA